jgi:thioredoxin 1
VPASAAGLAPAASARQRLHTIAVCDPPAAVSAAVSVAQLSDANFQAEVLEAATPVLVDVWAAWCGPCRLMAPLMDWAATEYAGRLAVGKLEADPNPATRDRLQVQGLPALIVFRNGEEVARHEGAMAKPQLQAFLDAHL